MRRRDLLKTLLSIPLMPIFSSIARAASGGGALLTPRVRPGSTGWPRTEEWDALKAQVGGRLIAPDSPFAQGAATTAEALKYLRNPYYLGDQPGLTETSGWFGAWTSEPSRYAVVAKDAQDVAAAVNFARAHRLRLVIKGGGHSYQGTSNAPDSLLIWTRHMREVQQHQAFVGYGCDGYEAPQPAVTLGAGCIWMDAYHAVTTLGGRYVQGGGCPTVGVAGLVQNCH